MLHRAFLLYLMVVGMMMMIQTSQARGLSNLLVRIDLERRASFAARQTGGGTGIPQVPSQCQSICDPVNAIFNTGAGCTPSSCCQPSFETSYFNCFICVGQAEGRTDYTQIQTSLDALVNSCALIGHDLPKLTFPGQNPNRTLSAVPSLASSTAATSSTAQTTVSSVTPPPYQSTVTAPTTSATSSTQSTPVSSLGVRSAQSGMLGLVLVVTMMGLVEFF